MRTHLFTGNRIMYPKSWHDNDETRNMSNGHTWQEHIPYTNVLWIKYILGYLQKNFRGAPDHAPALAQFREDTKELSRRLNSKTLVANGAFSTAKEICQYILDEGWATPDQIMQGEESFITNQSDGAIATDEDESEYDAGDEDEGEDDGESDGVDDVKDEREGGGEE